MSDIGLDPMYLTRVAVDSEGLPTFGALGDCKIYKSGGRDVVQVGTVISANTHARFRQAIRERFGGVWRGTVGRAWEAAAELFIRSWPLTFKESHAGAEFSCEDYPEDPMQEAWVVCESCEALLAEDLIEAWDVGNVVGEHIRDTGCECNQVKIEWFTWYDRVVA